MFNWVQTSPFASETVLPNKNSQFEKIAILSIVRWLGRSDSICSARMSIIRHQLYPLYILIVSESRFDDATVITVNFTRSPKNWTQSFSVCLVIWTMINNKFSNMSFNRD